MTKPEPRPDLLIVGGGPAGCAAAIAATRHKLRALIVEPQEVPQSRGCAGWLGPAAVRMCQELGVGAAAAHAVEFSGLRLWPWDLTKPAEIGDRKLAGWVVEPRALGAALASVTQTGGVQMVRGAATAIQLGEDGVAAQLSDGRAVTGRVLVIADGAGTVTARLAHLPATQDKGGRGAQAVVDIPETGSALDVILGAGRTIRVATIARHRRRACVTLMTHDAARSAAAQLAELLKAASGAGLLPAGAAADPIAVPCPAGAALEMESHVGKRCLLVGDAGGFVSAFSNEGIYPALRSGWLAADTAARALSAAVLQDELATFSAAWRTDLADYLQMPNTDLGLLLPMVFNNPQMARRLAQAFLLGQSF